MTKKRSIPYHLLALGGILLVILWYTLPLVRTQPIGYDGAYNAQVARHYAETGVYATTYPDELPFYKAITTGHTLLLPVAFLYRLFGLSHLTTAAIPILFSCVYAIAAYALFCVLTKGSLWTPLLVLFFALLPTYWVNALIPVGENAAIAMLLFALLCMVCARRAPSPRKSGLLWALAGGLMAVAFITKTIAMLYIGIFLMLLLLECLLFRTTPWKALLSLLGGFVVFFLVFDLFRLAQFGWSIIEWIKSWLAVFANTLRLGGHEGGIFQGLTFASIGEKLNALAGMSLTPFPMLFLCQLLLPIGLYAARFCLLLRKKPEGLCRIDEAIDPILLFSGIAGEAFLIYVLLFGSMELVIIRRLFVHLAMLQVFTGYACFRAASLAFSPTRDKARGIHFARAAVLIACAVLAGASLGGLHSVLRNRTGEGATVSPIRTLNEQLMEDVRALPEDAVIYTQGWWQAPEISLFAGRVFHPWEPGLTADDHTYFLMGDEIEAPEGWTGDPEDLLGWLGSIAEYETVAHYENEAAPAPHTYSLYKINAFLQ